MHCSGKRVVGRLGEVNVIVRMNGIFTAHDAAREFNSPVRNDFIGVHISLGAASRLPNAEGKVFVKLSLYHFVSRLNQPVCFDRR